jgi:hypothetical protein
VTNRNFSRSTGIWRKWRRLAEAFSGKVDCGFPRENAAAQNARAVSVSG